MNISLPDPMKTFLDEQVEARGYGSSSECVRALTHKDGDLQKLRGLLLGGAESSPIEPADAIYFDTLRARINGRRPA